VICNPVDFQAPQFPTKGFFLSNLFFASFASSPLFFLHRHKHRNAQRLTLYTTTLNSERRVTLLLTVLSILGLTMANTWGNLCKFFLGALTFCNIDSIVIALLNLTNRLCPLTLLAYPLRTFSLLYTRIILSRTSTPFPPTQTYSLALVNSLI
jgi:hypothetical protein